MTIFTQWLIFGAAIAALFAWGLFAKEGEQNDAKEGHTATPRQTRTNKTQPEVILHETANV